jgi:nitrate reductase cytochrome c-type subunit
MRIMIFVAAIVSSLIMVAQASEPAIATLRKAPLAEALQAPRMTPQSNTDIRRTRNYPEQPPVIPHKIEAY